MKNLKSVLSVTLAMILIAIFNISALAADASLPATGGIGTTIFYVGGALLIVGAVIFLLIKRRNSDGSEYDEDDDSDE